MKTQKLTLVILFLLAIHNLNAQNTNLGIGSGTGGTANVHIGKDAGAVSTASNNSILGFEAGKTNTTGNTNAFLGGKSGFLNTTGSGNSFVGYGSGYSNTTGSWNTFLGSSSGYANTTALGNTYLGSSAGRFNTTGSWNTFLGNEAGYSNIGGYQNVYIGNKTNRLNTSGVNNTVLGYTAYSNNTNGIDNVILGAGAGINNVNGSGNIFLGCRSGQNEMGSNKLYVHNSNTSTPLIYGEFDNSKLIFNGKVGISTNTFPLTVGTANLSAYKLFVKGGILTEELRVRTGWADYVFNEDYKLKPLCDVEQYIIENKHLPNVPTEKQVLEEGLEIGSITRIQQEKIEELTLYLIELNKKLEKQQIQINQLNKYK